MSKHLSQIIIFTTLGLLPSVTLCKSAVSTQSPRAPTVYVLEFKDEGGGSEDIGGFAQTLMLLRLRQMKTYVVETSSSDNEPECIPQAQPIVTGLQQITIGSDARYYAVKVFIRVRDRDKGSAVAVLDYELVKCRKGGQRTSLAKNNQTFPYSEVLGYLNSMADAIAFVLEQEQEVTKIAIRFTGVTGTTYASQLGDRVLERLKEAQEFEPQPASSATGPQPVPEYTLSGRTFTSNSKLFFEVEVRNRRGRTFRTVFDGPVASELNDALKAEGFLREKSSLALDYLTFVRNVADTDQPPPPSDADAEKSLRLSRELMCIPAPLGCVDQAAPAADLLTEVVRNKRFNSEENWALLGEALVRSGDYSRAGTAFSTAATLTQPGKSSVAAKYLEKAANAWLEAKNFAAALVAYDRWIQLAPTNVEAYLGKLKTYVYNNQYVNALDFLLTSFAALPDSKELKEQLEFLIESLPSTEFESAKRVVEARKQSPGTALAVLMLRRAEALEKAVIHMNQAQYDLMDTELKTIEAIARDLPEQSETAAIAVGLRGLWYRDARGDYDTAVRLLQDAKQKLKKGEDHSVEEVDTEIAKTIFKRGLARTDNALARRDLEEASAILTQAAKTAPTDYETLALLREVNHRLNKNRETRDFFHTLIDERTPDVDVALNLGFVCNSYLEDRECGARAADLVQRPGGQGFNSFASLLPIDTLTLKGEYDKALAAQQEIVKGGPSSVSGSLAVAHFYGILLQALQQKHVAAESFKLWYDSMTELRKRPRSDVDWVFDGVLRALDANTSVDANTKKLLHDMVAAMRDRKIPLPTAP